MTRFLRRLFKKRSAAPLLVFAAIALSGCAAAEKDWNALSPVEKDKIVEDALRGADKICQKYEGSGGQKNDGLRTACTGLRVGTAILDDENVGGSK